MRIRADFTFCASHQLHWHQGHCRNLHGHNYQLQVCVAGKPDPATGVVMDFYDLERVVREKVLSAVDHRHLNDLLANPTAEEILRFCWRRLRPDLPGLDTLVLWETPTCSAEYRGEDEP